MKRSLIPGMLAAGLLFLSALTGCGQDGVATPDPSLAPSSSAPLERPFWPEQITLPQGKLLLWQRGELTDSQKAAAQTAFNQYLVDHPALKDIVDAGTTILSADGDRVALSIRAENGGIHPMPLEGLVYDPAADRVAPRYSAWRAQGGYFGEGAACRAFYFEEMTLHIPEEYVQEIKENQWTYSLFSGRIESSAGGLYFGISRVPLTEMSPKEPAASLLWSDGAIGAESYEIGRDEENMYLLVRASDVEFDPNVPGEQTLYEQRQNESEIWADSFVLENKLIANPNWLWPPSGYRVARQGVRTLLNSVFLDHDRVFFTVPRFAGADQSQLFEDESIVLQGRQAMPDGTERQIQIPVPEGGWMAGETYVFSLEGLRGMTMTVAVEHQSVRTVALQLEDSYFTQPVLALPQF